MQSLNLFHDMKIQEPYLDIKRKEADPEADELITYLYSKNQEHVLYHFLQTPFDESLNNLTSDSLKAFLIKRRETSWYDPELTEKGQRFFKKYATEIMMLLGALSLPYCYAATPGNKAIFLTEKMRKKPGKRLLETADYVISLMDEKAFSENGYGWLLINKTRLIHAMVRYMLLHSGRWDDSWGVPINQEDMAGTNLAFSYIILEGLEKLKFNLSEDDKSGFLHIWRYIGYQNYIDEALLPENMNEGWALEEMIVKRNFRSSTEGKLLIKDLIGHYRSAFPRVAGFLVDSQIRYFLGEDVSDLLGLESNQFKDSFIKVINKLKESLNSMNIHISSYEKMLRDHEKLKEIYG